MEHELTESAEHIPKRAKMIFSVMTNLTRIEMLRVLNSKGPLTYSELKVNVGFKSKRESGKFAYHLRKLLRYSLISLNKQERRYMITNRGKLILGIIKQIEERSVIESGNIYVRTRNSLEEFNAQEIVQSLVREVNMPSELAEKIAEEVENRLYRMQGVYITSQLIRDMVNLLLLERNVMDYRNKFLTIGISYNDISSAIKELDYTSLQRHLADSVLRDYFFLTRVPKDIIDMHLKGDIDVANIHTWGILPDTTFIGIKQVITGKEHSYIDSMNDLYASLCIIISMLSRSASNEAVIYGMDVLSRVDPERFAKMLMLVSYNLSSLVTLVIDDLDKDDVSKVIDGYMHYIKNTLSPSIALSIDKDALDDNIEGIVKVASVGGLVSVSDGIISYKGVRPSSIPCATINNISVNTPRLAYESSNDEIYFLTKVMLLLKPIVTALHSRSGMIKDKATLYSNIQVLINMVDVYKAVVDVLKRGDRLLDIVRSISSKVKESSRNVGYDASIGIIDAYNTAHRFSMLDAELYGSGIGEYSNGVTIHASKIDTPIIDSLMHLDGILSKGIAVTLDIGNYDAKVEDAVRYLSSRIRGFRIVNSSVRICTTCRAKYYEKDYGDRCPNCNAYMKSILR